MELSNIIKKTRAKWDIHSKYTLFHQLISLVISQKIRFAIGRQIRSNLYNHFKLEIGSSLTYDQIAQLSPNDYKIIKMPSDKIIIIQNILGTISSDNKLLALANSNNYHHNYDNNINIADLNALFLQLGKISGIGPWTVNALKIMFYSDKYTDILLLSDKWIQARFLELDQEIRDYINHKNMADKLNLSEISLFLWRIKSSGTQKINKGIELADDDFL